MSDESKGINIVPDEQQPAEQTKAQEPDLDPAQNVDPNEVLNHILQGLSGLQAVMEMFEARIGQVEKLTGYLLQKDPQFIENFKKMESQAQANAEAQQAVNPTAAIPTGKEDGTEG